MNIELIRIKVGFGVLKLALRILPDIEVFKWINHVKETKYDEIPESDNRYAERKESSGYDVLK